MGKKRASKRKTIRRSVSAANAPRKYARQGAAITEPIRPLNPKLALLASAGDPPIRPFDPKLSLSMSEDDPTGRPLHPKRALLAVENDAPPRPLHPKKKGPKPQSAESGARSGRPRVRS
jgi:hypothetical protein